jgi:hypothetical protein
MSKRIKNVLFITLLALPSFAFAEGGEELHLDLGLTPFSVLAWFAVVVVVVWLAIQYAGQDKELHTVTVHGGHGHGHDDHDHIDEPDDLKKIEGIGPKTSGVLAEAGITTFAQLAAMEAGDITTILREAGLRLGDPSTWAEQAALAAKGDWDGLEKLQDELIGGRRA